LSSSGKIVYRDVSFKREEVIDVIRGIVDITLFSEKPKKLADFYQKVVGLKLTGEFVMGDKDEEVYLFEMRQGAGLSIVHHSKVKGKNKLPERIIFNLEVGKIKDEVLRVKGKGAKLIQDVYHVEGYGYIATFQDPDGNFFQLVQIRA